MCRTGYTGELGYELVVPAEHAVAVWDALFAAGAAYELRACGLAARDTLRTEMGYPLHGQDLSLEITPVQARSGWAVGWDKPAFWGRDALLAEKAAGPRPYAARPGGGRPGHPAPRHGGARRATPRSARSPAAPSRPTRKQGIALALLDTDAEAGRRRRGRGRHPRPPRPDAPDPSPLRHPLGDADPARTPR